MQLLSICTCRLQKFRVLLAEIADTSYNIRVTSWSEKCSLATGHNNVRTLNSFQRQTQLSFVVQLIPSGKPIRPFINQLKTKRLTCFTANYICTLLALSNFKRLKSECHPVLKKHSESLFFPEQPQQLQCNYVFLQLRFLADQLLIRTRRACLCHSTKMGQTGLCGISLI